MDNKPVKVWRCEQGQIFLESPDPQECPDRNLSACLGTVCTRSVEAIPEKCVEPVIIEGIFIPLEGLAEIILQGLMLPFPANTSWLEIAEIVANHIKEMSEGSGKLGEFPMEGG